MNRDLSIIKVTEKFSFIRTINIYSCQNDNQKSYHYKTVIVDDNFDQQKNIQNSVNSKYAALCNVDKKNSSITLPTENLATISNDWYSIDNLKSNITSEFLEFKESEKQNKTQINSFNSVLDKILIIFAGSYLCFTLWIIFGSKNAIFPMSIFNKNETISQADVEFVEYMKQSLATIDRQLTNTQSSPSKSADSKNETSEIVYVPIYTPTKTIEPNKINFPQANTLPLPPLPPKQLATISNPPISTISIEPPPPPSESIEVKTKPLEKPAATPVETPEVTAAVVKPKITHTLIGVIELKEGSAALFKVDGVTQRIWLGEKIENTDWILDSVVEQKVIIRNQENTLTLNVGESFK